MKSKEQKRVEAIERQQAYDALTLQQRFDRALDRPGLSRREINRILATK